MAKNQKVTQLEKKRAEREARKKAAEAAADEMKKRLEPRKGFSNSDATRISNQLSKALGEIDGSAHHWAGMVLMKIKPILKVHADTLARHKDHEAYNKERQAAAVLHKNGLKLHFHRLLGGGFCADPQTCTRTAGCRPCIYARVARGPQPQCECAQRESRRAVLLDFFPLADIISIRFPLRIEALAGGREVWGPGSLPASPRTFCSTGEPT